LNIVLLSKESVKETQRVTIDEIPMPELPQHPTSSFHDAPRSILKQKRSEKKHFKMLKEIFL
jgi:hypothetical protein